MTDRPVVLSVDDDQGVSRALARDLRRRYADRYRIVRTESGPAALEALREFTVRGERTALLLADYRMPEMTGVDFLEQAMDLVPTAMRVLLTAYADTDAAIRAINDVDIDRYLLKPWNPPEERLYPALDELLELWGRSSRPAFEGTTLIGHQWSAPTQEVKEFLARNQVPYRHLDVTDAAAQRLLSAAQVGADAALPVVLLPDGSLLTQPSLRELAERVGLATTAGSPFYDLVVIGGGPAGLGAAVYGASEGLRTLLVERAATGGQAGQSSRIENYLGFPKGVSGGELAQRARDQAVAFDVEIVTAAEVTGIAPVGDGKVVHLDDGNEVTAHAVVLATGVSYTRHPAPGVDDLVGRGVFYGAASHEAVNCKGQQVYIVGGANSAGQAALYFTRYAGEVVVLVRRSDLRQTMSEYLVARIEADPRITVRTCTEIIGATGEDQLQRLALRNTATGALDEVDASWLFIFIGAVPRTDWLSQSFLRDSRGFLLAGPDLLDQEGRPPPSWPIDRQPFLLETSVPGVFVAGDVRAGSVKRVASAVGDGAMAVTLVHRYLEKP